MQLSTITWLVTALQFLQPALGAATLPLPRGEGGGLPAAGLVQSLERRDTTSFPELNHETLDSARVKRVTDVAVSVGGEGHVEKRFLAAIIAACTGTFGGFFGTFNMGFAVLGGLAQGGRAILQATGIIRGAIQGVLAIWTRGFALVGGFRRSVHGDMPVYGTLTRDPADIAAAGGRGEDMSWAWTELEVHIPLDSGETSLRAAAMLANNGTEFLHIATTYRDSVPRHKLYYRRAHPNELGADYNDDENGSVHHARAIAVGDTLTPGEPGGSSKRAEVNNQGTVMDYLWRYENKQGWTDLHNSAKTFDQDAARISTTWMQQQEAEAICSTVIWKSKPDPNVQGFGGAVDAGIMAFGWNNKPYGFNGRAGKWVDSCQWQGE